MSTADARTAHARNSGGANRLGRWSVLRLLLVGGLCAPLTGVALVASTVAASPAQATSTVPSVPLAPKSITYAATLVTAGQDMWGPTTTAPPTDQTTTFFDKSWSASGGFNQETDVSYDPCAPVPLIPSCAIDFGTYGAKLTASTSGEIGLSGSTHGTTGGTIGVNYPMSFGLTGPADDSFAPGDSVTVATTSPSVTAGASISSVYPQFSSVSLDGKFGFHAAASGEICVGTCVGGTIFDLNYPTGSGAVASGQILSLSTNDLLLIQGLGLAKCFGVAEGVLFGASTYPNAGHFCENTVSGQDNGYLAFPDVKLGSTTAAVNLAGGAPKLSASGSDQYMVIPVSAVAWAAKIASLPFGFPNLSASFSGTGVNYTTVNDILAAVVTQTQGFRFDPSVNVTLDFGQSITYAVKTPVDGTVLTGAGSTATFPLGDKIQFAAPAGPMQVVPTVAMGTSTITNHTCDTVAGTNQVQALALSASIGGCCSGIFPGIAVNLGPVYDSGPVPLDSAQFERTNRTWQLAGFNASQLAPFSVTPDPLPLPTPVTVAPVEGASFTGVVGTFIDPDVTVANAPAASDQSAIIDWGDGSISAGTITGTGAGYAVHGTHTYAEEGTYQVTATVTDTDTPTVHAAAVSTALVSDAALSLTGQPQLNTTEGAPATAGTPVAGFTDADPAAAASDFHASIDWGDGTARSIGAVSAGPGSGFTVSAPSHTYAEEGTPMVLVTITDQGGATTTASPPMLTVDAALHSTGLTNGTLTGSGNPVLLWPGTGNAVLAHLTDDDPLGTSSDYTALVSWGDGSRTPAVVSADPAGGFAVTGNHVYANADLGTHVVTIDLADGGGATTQTQTTLLAYGFSASGTFAIGDSTLSALAPSYGTTARFWGASWNKANALSGGAAPSSFKGFISNPPANATPPQQVPASTTWTTVTGSSAPPPDSVPAYMLVLVTSKVTQSGSVLTGNATHWVVMRTDSDYAPNAGHPGTGTVVATLS